MAVENCVFVRDQKVMRAEKHRGYDQQKKEGGNLEPEPVVCSWRRLKSESCD